MMRALHSAGTKEETFKEWFSGKKTLRDVLQSELSTRQAKVRTKALEANLEAATKRCADLEARREGETSSMLIKLDVAEQRANQAAEASAEAAAMTARAEELERQVAVVTEEARVAREDVATGRSKLEQREKLLAQFTETLQTQKKMLATSKEEKRRLRSALQNQESVRQTEVEEAAPNAAQMESELRLAKRQLVEQLDAAEDEARRKLRESDRRWEQRFDAREEEWRTSAARERRAGELQLLEYRQAVQVLSRPGKGKGKGGGGEQLAATEELLQAREVRAPALEPARRSALPRGPGLAEYRK